MLFKSNIANAQWNTIDANIYYNAGNVAIGHDYPQASLHLFKPSLANNKIIIENRYTIGLGIDGLHIGMNNLDGYVSMPQNRSLSLKTLDIPRLTILGNGNIGIGTVNPDTTFHLVGSFKYIDGNQAAKKILTSDANGVGTWQELTLNLNSNQLTINGFSTVDLSIYLDNTDEQNLSLSGTTLNISNGTGVDMSSFMDNTDNQDGSISGHDLTIDNGSTITLPDNIDDADADPQNEIQDLNLSGNILTITNNTNATNIDLSNTNYWTQTSTEKLYYNNGFVGIGITNPNRQLQIHSNIDEGGAIEIGHKGLNGMDINRTYKSSVLLTNTSTGATSYDGLKLESNNNNGILRLQEAGELSLLVQNYGIRIKQDGNLKFDKLAGTGERILITDAQGNISATETNSFADNLGDHTATESLKMKEFNISFNPIEEFNISQSGGGPIIKMYSKDASSKSGGISIISYGTGTIRFTNWDGTNWSSLMSIKQDGNVKVKGKIFATEIEVLANVYPDFVFENNYKLMPITELEKYIAKHNHLPEVPTSEDVAKNNMKLGEMNVLLLKKVEELTLYIIDLQKQIDELKEN